MPTLDQDLTSLLNRHYAAVQTDTELGHSDSFPLEKKAKQLWDNYHEKEKQFRMRLKEIEGAKKEFVKEEQTDEPATET